MASSSSYYWIRPTTDDPEAFDLELFADQLDALLRTPLHIVTKDDLVKPRSALYTLTDPEFKNREDTVNAERSDESDDCDKFVNEYIPDLEWWGLRQMLRWQTVGPPRLDQWKKDAEEHYAMLECALIQSCIFTPTLPVVYDTILEFLCGDTETDIHLAYMYAHRFTSARVNQNTLFMSIVKGATFPKKLHLGDVIRRLLCLTLRLSTDTVRSDLSVYAETDA